MERSNRILAATDFNEASLSAIKYAVFIANHTNAKIDLLHVIERRAIKDFKNDKAGYKAHLKSIHEKLEEVKISSGAAFRISDHVIITDEDFYSVIVDYGVEHALDLCCLGVSSSAKHSLGDNTEILVKKADFPILTTRTVKEPIQFKNLLLPIDISKYTNEKVERIINFASQFDSTIHLLGVSEFFEELTRNTSAIKEDLENAAKEIRKNGLQCTTEIIRTDYVENSISDYADEIEADLLVIMSKQENRIFELILGSRVNKVIGQSKIPVLSFRPVEEE